MDKVEENLKNENPPEFKDEVWNSNKGLRDLIKSLMVFDISKRLTWKEIFDTDYVKQLMEK